MIDPLLRQILESMHELRQVAPPHSRAEHAMANVRSALSDRHRPMKWRRLRLAGAIAAAVALVVSIPLLSRHPISQSTGPEDSRPQAATPLVQLKQAIEASNQYRGVVNIRVADFQADDRGLPKANSQAAEIVADTLKGIATVSLAPRGTPVVSLTQARPGPLTSGAGSVQMVPLPMPQPSAPQASVMLIPITWEGAHTIPIPLTWDQNVTRYISLESQTMVTRSIGNDGQELFSVLNTLFSGSRPDPGKPEKVTVSIDPAANRVKRVEMFFPQPQGTRIVSQDYTYGDAPATAAAMSTPAIPIRSTTAPGR